MVKTERLLKTESMISLYSGKRYLLSFDSAPRAGTVTPWAVKKTQEYKANAVAVKSQRGLRNKTSTHFQEKPQWVLQNVKCVRNPGMLGKQGTGYSGSFTFGPWEVTEELGSERKSKLVIETSRSWWRMG